MAFVNTRDTIGDQATVDGLVDDSLTELKEDGIGIVEIYACHKNYGLQSVELPGVSHIKENAFDGCSNLEVVKLGGEGSSNLLSIAANAFNACSKLKHLIIDRPAMAILAGTSAFTGTQIALGEGAVYVPEALLSDYKGNTKWKNYFIARLQDYPLSSFDSISDSWSTILSNASYATAYTVKGTKTMELTDGTKIKMDLAALDTDEKSDDSGTAKMTWICHGIPYTHRMNASSDTNNGWIGSEMRSYLISDILSKIPTEIKSHIVSVKKSYRSKSPTDGTLWSDDEIWIPSYKEVGLTNSTNMESDGVTYPGLFTSGTISAANATRIKYNTSGSADSWWLRTTYNATNFRRISISGSDSQDYALGAYGVVFGFCTD